VAKRVVIVLLESWVSGVMVMWVSGFIIHYVMPIYRLFIINRINQQSIIFIITPHSLIGSGRSLGGRCVWVGFVCLPSNMNLEESPQKPWRMTKKDRLIGLGVRYRLPSSVCNCKNCNCLEILERFLPC